MNQLTKVEPSKDLIIQLKCKNPITLKSDLVQAIKHSVSLFHKIPSLATLQSMDAFKELLLGIDEQGVKKELEKVLSLLEKSPNDIMHKLGKK